MSEAPTLSRRDRLRLQTLDEIRAHAFAQVDAGGPEALSLNAIAKAMGMSGPAIYRYFASRDALLVALITDAYGELTGALEEAGRAAARRAPARRLAAVGEAYRAWALAHPRRYAMVFGVRGAEVPADPEEAIDEIHGGMRVLLAVLGELAGGGAAGVGAGGGAAKLDRQLEAWAVRRGTDTPLPPHVLRWGVLTWTRIHGLVSLELAGVLGDMGLDGGLLLTAELDAVVAALAPAGG